MDKKRLIASAGLILLFPLSLAAGWFYAKSLPGFYSASAVVVNQKGADRIHFDAPVIPTHVFVQTELEIIKSKTVLLPIIQKLGINEKIRQRSETSLSADEICSLFLSQYLCVRQFGESTLIEIVATAPTPNEAADIANAVAEQYVQYHADKLLEDANNALAPWREKVEEQEKLVDELSAKVNELRAEQVKKSDDNNISNITICPACSLLYLQISNQEEKLAQAKADVQTDPKIVKTLENELQLLKDQKRQIEQLDGQLNSKIVRAERELEAQQLFLKVMKVRYQQEAADAQLNAKNVPVMITRSAEPNPRPVQPRLDLILIISGTVGLVPLSAGVGLFIVAARKKSVAESQRQPR